MSVQVRFPVVVDYASALKSGLERNLPLDALAALQQQQHQHQQQQHQQLERQQHLQLQQQSSSSSSSSTTSSLSTPAPKPKLKAPQKKKLKSNVKQAASSRNKMNNSNGSNNTNGSSSSSSKKSKRRKRTAANAKNKAKIGEKMTATDVTPAPASVAAKDSTTPTTTTTTTMMMQVQTTTTGTANDGGGLQHHCQDAEMRSSRMMTADDGIRYGIPDGSSNNNNKMEDEDEQQQQQQQSEIQQQQQQQRTFVEEAAADYQALLEDQSTPLGQFMLRAHNLSEEGLYNLLNEYIILQEKYHTVLALPRQESEEPPLEITEEIRNGSAHLLRYLKIWFELPTDVLFAAISLVDRFLGRMRVKPKHMTCLTVASFYLAVKQLNCTTITVEQIVNISQAGCTVNDVERMANIIINKLGVNMAELPITSLSFLRIFYALFSNLTKRIGGEISELFTETMKLTELQTQLEVLLCNMNTSVVPPAVLALAYISRKLDMRVESSIILKHPALEFILGYIVQLQNYLKTPLDVHMSAFAIISEVLDKYNGQQKCSLGGKVIWRLSGRTMRLLQNCKNYKKKLSLQTIFENEHGHGQCGRFRNDSTGSEDWPSLEHVALVE